MVAVPTSMLNAEMWGLVVSTCVSATAPNVPSQARNEKATVPASLGKGRNRMRVNGPRRVAETSETALMSVYVIFRAG